LQRPGRLCYGPRHFRPLHWKAPGLDEAEPTPFFTAIISATIANGFDTAAELKPGDVVKIIE
jgi:hypothetical protein